MSEAHKVKSGKSIWSQVSKKNKEHDLHVLRNNKSKILGKIASLKDYYIQKDISFVTEIKYKIGKNSLSIRVIPIE